MLERTLVVKAPLGLHARAAAKLVRVASEFQSSVELRRIDTGAAADAKSILDILMLAASNGTNLIAYVEGADEEGAMNAIDEIFADGFGELDPEQAT